MDVEIQNIWRQLPLLRLRQAHYVLYGKQKTFAVQWMKQLRMPRIAGVYCILLNADARNHLEYRSRLMMDVVMKWELCREER